MLSSYNIPTFGTCARSDGEALYPNLRRGLIGAWYPAFGSQGSYIFDVIRGKNISLSSTGTTWNYPYGCEIGTTSSGIGTCPLMPIQGTSEISVTVWAIFKSTTGLIMTDQSTSTTSTGSFSLLMSAGSFVVFTVNGQASLTSPKLAGASLGAMNVVTGVYKQSSRYEIYLNGGFAKGSSTPSAVLQAPAGTTTNFGNVGSLTSTCDVVFLGMLFHNRALFPSEARMLSIDPLAPIRKKNGPTFLNSLSTVSKNLFSFADPF
jgi:hypothetical protein